MKIVVAHPGRQHSYRLASALKKQGFLLQYITTIYSKKTSLLMKIVKLFLSADNKMRANKRCNPDLNDTDVTLFCEYTGLLEALIVRLDKSQNIYRIFSDWNSNRFGVKVAKYAIKNNADAVVCYDSNATACFSYLKMKAPHIIRIMDVSSTARPYRKRIYEKEIVKSGRSELKVQNEYLWNENCLKSFQQEIDDTELFFCPSTFVKESLMACNVSPNSIAIIPYGTNIRSDIIRPILHKDDVIHFLFVGQVNYNKGVPYLLEAFNVLEEDRTHLTIVGAYNPVDWYVEKYVEKQNISFMGSVTFDKMMSIYEKSDVFVFPSFSEGMALSGIEAMSCGLPIICTHNSGVSDLVHNGENGFVVIAGNVHAISEKMKWFMDNPERICDMGESARQAAKKYTWERYEDDIVNAIRQINVINRKE